MNVQNFPNKVQNISFKGLEAKKLDYILVTQNQDFGSNEIINQLEAIAAQHKILVQKAIYYNTAWLQDELYFTPNRNIFSSNYNYASFYADVYNSEIETLKNKKYTCTDKHIDGGNIFFVTDKNGKQVLLSAKNQYGECEAEGYEKEYNVDKIIPLPRADYHADLFITPIGDNKILVANDNLMIKGMEKIITACYDYIKKNPTDEENDEIELVADRINTLKSSFKKCQKNYTYKDCDEEAAKVLENNGFEVIKVPSRIYNFEKWHSPKNKDYLTHLLNYSNAITFKTRNNEPVLITGKSGIERKLGLTKSISDKIGINFEKLFIDSISKHIKPQNVHFISGARNRPISEILENFKGGLHCMCSEVPTPEEELILK